MIDNDDVRAYYDANTRSFLRFGQGRGTGTIRRAIWAPGVSNREDAFHFVDAEIARRLDLGRRPGARIVDLGCGIGGSLVWLAERFDIEATGVTLSPVQAGIAREWVGSRTGQLRGSVTIVARDFHDFIPSEPEDAAIAIESFVHVPDAGQFFQQLRRYMHDARLVEVMFCVAEKLDRVVHGNQKVIDNFRRG